MIIYDERMGTLVVAGDIVIVERLEHLYAPPYYGHIQVSTGYRIEFTFQEAEQIMKALQEKP